MAYPAAEMYNRYQIWTYLVVSATYINRLRLDQNFTLNSTETVNMGSKDILVFLFRWDRGSKAYQRT